MEDSSDVNRFWAVIGSMKATWSSRAQAGMSAELLSGKKQPLVSGGGFIG
ncbi:MAG TPA: hypothetical protein IAB39_09960 [Candidatus Onthovicinus excrementipullorum]|nr:hypothetical protein [Candidatus Onthovicinus excrementipullorum]